MSHFKIWNIIHIVFIEFRLLLCQLEDAWNFNCSCEIIEKISHSICKKLQFLSQDLQFFTLKIWINLGVKDGRTCSLIRSLSYKEEISWIIDNIRIDDSSSIWIWIIFMIKFSFVIIIDSLDVYSAICASILLETFFNSFYFIFHLFIENSIHRTPEYDNSLWCNILIFYFESLDS